MAKTVKYDAFISYRHCEPDSDIAAKLQKKLEGFRLPKDIAKKLGRTRLNRVFRDETEFAVSDDLTQAIVVYSINYEYSGNNSAYYKVYPVTYEELISMADEYLDGYEPDERVKEKYSLD